LLHIPDPLAPPRTFCIGNTDTVTTKPPCATKQYEPGPLEAKARADLRKVVVDAAYSCGLFFNSLNKGEVGVAFYNKGFCDRAMQVVANQLAAVKELEAQHAAMAAGASVLARRPGMPGASSIVALASPPTARSQASGCPTRLRARVCAALLAARTNYENALASLTKVYAAQAFGVHQFLVALSAALPSDVFLQQANATCSTVW
jgi:hypothetical protein